MDESEVFLDAEDDLEQRSDLDDSHGSLEPDDDFEDAEESEPEEIREALDAEESKPEEIREALDVSKAAPSFAGGWQRSNLRTVQTSFEGCQSTKAVPRAQSSIAAQTGREYIPGVGANRRQGENIYREWEPIADKERVYTGSGSQSKTGREYIPGMGANRRQGE
eukprot:1191945-Prorocentrum_minimum.AAC.1